MSRGDYLEGSVLLFLVLGACGAAAAFVVRARLAWMAREARWVAGSLLFTAAIALVHLLPLVLGVLTRLTPVAAALLLAFTASRLGREAEAAEPSRAAPSNRVSAVLAGIAVAASAVFVLGYLATYYDEAISDVDSTTFILPGVGRWMQEGSLWLGDEFAPGWGFMAYPMNGNLMQLSVMLPWHSDFAVRAVGPAFLALTGLAVFAMAVELGASRAAAAVCGVLVALLPMAAVVGLDNAQTDPMMAAWFACGALFLLRHARTGRREELWLAGLGLGLAAMTKWYGPPEVLALLAVWVLARLIARHRIAAVAVDGLRVGLITAAAGGIWLVRNIAMFDNPIFPGGSSVFPAPEETVAEKVDRSIASYLDEAEIVREVVVPQLWDSFQVGGALVLVGAVLAVVLALRSGDGRVLAVACAAGLIAIVYVTLPNSALTFGERIVLVSAASRYALPIFVLAAVVTAWALSRVPYGAAGAAVVAVIALVTGVDAVETPARALSDVGVAALLKGAVALALVAAAVAVLRHQRARLPVLAGAVCLALLVAGWAGRRAEQTFSAQRYAKAPPVLQTVAERAASVERIGLAGETGPGPSSPVIALGPRFETEVHYVGGRDSNLLIKAEDPRAFVAELDQGDYDLLVVGRDQGTALPADWAQDAGWRTVQEDPLFLLLEPPGAG